MTRVARLPLILLVLPAAGYAQTVGPESAGNQSGNHGLAVHPLPSPSVRAVRREGPITIDGRLDEPLWITAPAATDFRQAEPKVGEPATQRTEVRILFDDEALYIGARMFDDQGARGVRTQLARRDQSSSNSDWIELIFDTYHDHVNRSASLQINPSGVKQDQAYDDESWDPVWQVKTEIDSLGWTAEFRIPFSQLRFARDTVQVWGLQVWRRVTRLNEISMWSYSAPEETGGPSRFGHIVDLSPGRGGTRRLELLPYTVGRYRRLQPGDPNDPFYQQRSVDGRFGADLKYLLTSNLTLDATINPDFGQVEVDPAVVNLSAFETFFQERRPFFVEGSGTFGFGGFNCFFCSNVSSLSMFYSRRIGRAPQGPLPEGASYADRPDASTILGAAKVTGRTRQGFTIGVLNAVTARERATVLVGDDEQRHEVEPFTNYFVGRVKQDLEQGNLVLGAMGTSVIRSLGDSLLRSRLNAHSEAIGFDGVARWKNRTYTLRWNVAFTNNSGDPAAIERLQLSSARYFQRPDRKQGSNGFLSDRYDPTATSLRGMGGYGRFAKEGGKFLFETAVNWRTPGFEANDLAFNTRADYIWTNANVALSLPRPTKWYRNYFLVTGAQTQYNFDGDRTDTQIHAGAFGQLLNYWGVNLFVIRRFDVFDDRLTRGGPVVKRPGNMYYAAGVGTDGRKRISVEFNPSFSRTDDGYTSTNLYVGFRIRPASNISISLSPGYGSSRSSRQYVTRIADETQAAFYGSRYLFADLEQKNVSLDTRVNLTFTPTLSFELYAQPFLSSQRYSRFKEIAAPRSQQTVVFGEDAGTVTTDLGSDGRVATYRIDPDGTGPAPAFDLENPDFNFRSLRGNAVLRWEYRPGSTLYLVWTRDGSDFASRVGNFDFSRDVNAMFNAKANNIFLVKVSYWLNR